MATLLSVIPKTIPAARRALAAMERDVDAAKTYDAIRRIERAADAMRLLFREVEEVRHHAEIVVVLANHRIGQELSAQPVAKGTRGQGRPKKGAARKAAPKTPSLKEQVGSQKRGLRLKKLATLARPEVAAAIAKLHEAGKEATVSGVLKLIHGDDKAERRAERERALAAKIMALPTNRYGVLYADPPWRFEPYSRDTGMDRAADNHYSTMATEDICRLDVPAAKDCALFLWATAAMLFDALQVIQDWGFHYRSHLIWRKDKIGTGYWSRNRHELLLIATRGNIPAPAMGEQPESVIDAPVREHSHKPVIFAAIIEGMFPNLPRLEMFARPRLPRPGWDVWGNEVGAEPTRAAS